MGSTPHEVNEYNSMYLSLQPHHDPEVCTASNINEYHKIFWNMILGSKTWPASNLTANYKMIIQTMFDVSQLNRPPRPVSGIALFLFFCEMIYFSLFCLFVFSGVILCDMCVCVYVICVLCTDLYICVLYCCSDIATGKNPFAVWNKSEWFQMLPLNSEAI
jgi:hypothetical protein